MNRYIYRAIATADCDAEQPWEDSICEGQTLGGRAVGYFSRSSAVDAGEASGVPYRIQRSEPITWSA